MGTEDRNSIAKSKPPKQKDSRVVRRLAKSHKDKETSAAPAPFPAPHWLNSVQVQDSNRIQYTQDGFSLPNSQLHYLPQLMQPNPIPQFYPGFYHMKSPHAYFNAVGVHLYIQSVVLFPHLFPFQHIDCFNYVQDSMLPISEKGKDIPREKDLDSGRSKDEGTSYRNHTHDPSRSAASGDEASPDGRDDANQDLSATKKQRLNQTKADDCKFLSSWGFVPCRPSPAVAMDGVTFQFLSHISFFVCLFVDIVAHPDIMMDGSASDVLEPALNLAISNSSAGSISTTAKISDVYDLRKQRRRQLNRESAKRSRLRKQQERDKLEARIEVLKGESSALCEELNRVSEECGRLYEENKLIMEELIPMCGPDDDLAALWAELHA
ncbi:Basic-leucine zipper domain - like 10 [Theobroma cacao]|nr:Basic-leucine zipper domain - like 10 [Theobroma cacao]